MAVVDEILIGAAPGETRYALISGGRAVEFAVDRGDAGTGDVLLGRILSVTRGLDAAFVDIGEAEAGFLARPGALSAGQAAVFQVTAPARPGKGAVLTARPSFEGRLLIYSPGRPGLSLSKRLADEAERRRLKSLLDGLKAPGEGIVVRSQAAGADPASLMAELESARGRWRAVQAKAASAQAPRPLDSTPLLARLLAEHPGCRSVRVDRAGVLAQIRGLFPDALHDPQAFERHGAQEDFQAALEPELPLPGGGRLIIEQTAALAAIDVDGGQSGAETVNRAAILAAARAIRLRNISGQIVLDLIGDGRHAAPLVALMREAVADDPTPTHVLGVSRLGLLEMIRERRRPGLAEMMLAPGFAVPNALALALEGLARLVDEQMARPALALALALGPAGHGALSRRPAALAEAARLTGRRPVLRLDPDLAHYKILEVRS